MLTLSELDGKRYDPDDKDQQYCLRKAKCYIDRTVDPPVIRYIGDGRGYPPTDDYEIIGWVWLTERGELKANGVNVTPGDNSHYFIYNKNSNGVVGDTPTKKFPPGVYYLIRKNGREILVSEKTLKSL
ncbi:hypothetical protein [Saccharolobus islandicus]|uniref:Uncharacterized protein n=1 Tax=Saccharolobus islandicus (strain M.16.4 / Kamchatka \|nr:hypothetical protein [Sulfolobus islandicus]ACR41946.1 hypothetical protein M164_1340 [Sulfolobus islandicus M.16.4]